ncbi:MAG: TIR domain-containing protein [Terricaulis sp.]
MKPISVFISYASHDVASAELLEKLLAQRGLHVWRDKTRLKSGERFGDKIRQALTSSQKVIVLWSPHSVESDWVWGEAELARSQKKYLGYLIRGCTLQQISQQFWRYHHPSISDWRRSIDEVLGPAGVSKVVGGKSAILGVEPSLHRLPSRYASDIVGRESELDALSAAWNSGETSIVSIEAMGGTGKTTLIQKWLDVMETQGWRGAAKVFAYSFYEQGTDENPGGDATEFFDLALKYFGYDGPALTNDSEKAETLAHLVTMARSLLVLDGIEPLQYPAHSPGLAGKLRNAGLSVLLRQLLHQEACLCIITTRIQIAGLRTDNGRLHFRKLPHLNATEGVALLRSLGVRGRDDELEVAVAENDGYALALSLLGRHLIEFGNGDIGKAIPVEDIPVRSDERSLQRVMRRYEISFEERIKEQEAGGTRRNETASARQLEIMRLLGLFNRPCSIAALLAITNGDPIKGLVEACAHIDENKLNHAIHELRRIGLILPSNPDFKGQIDAHPSVRGYYSNILATATKVPEGSVTTAHLRLFRYFKAIVPSTPRTLADFLPAFSAISHGASAGQMDEAISDLLVGVVLNASFRAPTRLGAHGILLTSIAGYFPRIFDGSPDWSKPSAKLAMRNRASVATTAGFSLRALGRMAEAVKAFGAATDLAAADGKEPSTIVSTRRHLSMALLESGRIGDAALQAQLTHLPLSKANPLSVAHNYVTLGQILHAQGEFAKAREAFREGEALAASPHRPLLRGRSAYHLSELLEDVSDMDEVQRRASEMAEHPLANPTPLDRAFELLLQSALNSKKTRMADAKKQVSVALSIIRENGDSTYIPIALLQRASLERQDGKFEEARGTLRECGSQLEDTELLLHSIDCALEQARCNLDMLNRERPSIIARLNPTSARKRTWTDTMNLIDDAQKRITDSGYLRRDSEVRRLRELCLDLKV